MRSAKSRAEAIASSPFLSASMSTSTTTAPSTRFSTVT
jgi:hypothetical protein